MPPTSALLLLFVLTTRTSALPRRHIANLTLEPRVTANDVYNGNELSQSNGQQSKDMQYIAAAKVKNCTLFPEDTSITAKIRDALDDDTKMIKFYLNIMDHDRMSFHSVESHLYQPFYWVRAKDRIGTGLLFLRPEYDVLSLATLEIGVETMFVNLTYEPVDCLNNLSYSDIEVLIRELVMNDFEDTRSAEQLALIDTTDSVCNLHILDSDGTADFRYFCCHKNASSVSNGIRCVYLEPDTWLNMLLHLITVLKVLVVLFSPCLVPKSLYRLKIDSRYWYKINQSKPLKIKVLLTKSPEDYPNAKNKFTLSAFRFMKKFKHTLKEMHQDIDTPQELQLNHVQLRVKHGFLLSATCTPVSVFKMIYQSFVKCKIRTHPSLRDCCNTNILLCSKCENTWYKVLKRLSTAIFVFILTTPWIARCYFYFKYEHEETRMRSYAASKKSLSMDFPGNLALMLTPLHFLFIVIYALLILETCLFGLVIKKLREQFKFVFRKTFHDMNETDFSGVINETIKFLVYPCKAFGGLGLIFGLITWTISLPFFVLFLAFYMFPTLNMTLRLLAYFGHILMSLCPGKWCKKLTCFEEMSKLLDKIEKDITMNDIESAEELDASVMKSKWKLLQQLVVIMMCLVTLYSTVFLTMEFVSFFVEMLVYIMIGLILNAEVTLTYISLTVLLAAYAHECFHSVEKKYRSFNKTMNETVSELCKETLADNTSQTNIAFRLKSNQERRYENPVQLTSDDDKLPAWQFSRLLLFIGRNNQPAIPKRFFFKSCNIPFYTAPKRLVANYINAVLDFAKILLFLLFVLVVVLSFGNAYHISATNKMLAAIAGGLLPFMLKTFVFKAQSVEAADKDNMHYQLCVQNLIDDYQETWPVYDIDLGQLPADITATASQGESFAGSQPDTSVANWTDTTSVSMSSVRNNSNNVSGETCPLLGEERVPGNISNGGNETHKTMNANGGVHVPETDICNGNGKLTEVTGNVKNGRHQITSVLKDADIDLLIYYTGKIDTEAFPGMD